MYRLVKKASVGAAGMVIRRGEEISEEQYNELPERARQFFEKVKQQKKAKKEGD